MSTPIPYLLQGRNIILVIAGKSHTISKDTHMNYGKIVDALKAKEWDELAKLVEPKKAIINFGKGYVSIENGVVYWKGTPFNNALSARMIDMYKEGFPIEPMVNFMENLMSNPSKRSVDQVYKFLEKNNLPITEDGYFLAYKKVCTDYMDIHSGTIDNSIGKVIEMDRNLVDDNPDSHCSTGLHFCSISYLDSFGSGSDPVMIMKINPADVVSVPNDYNGAKGRCCKYEVIAQVSGDPADAFASVVDYTYSKVAPAAPVSTPWPPEVCWPFPVSETEERVSNVWPAPAQTSVKPAKARAVAAPKITVPKSVGGSVGIYNVRRKSSGLPIAWNLSLHDARELVNKAVLWKQAALQIVDAKGNIVK